MRRRSDPELNFSLLAPAGLGSAGDTGNDLQFHRYWDFDFQEPENCLRDEEYVEELDRLFCQAVERQLVSDVDLGSYLSGGMDSGSITAIAATQRESSAGSSLSKVSASV